LFGLMGFIPDQDKPKNLPMLRFRGPSVLSRPYAQAADDIGIQIANCERRHRLADAVKRCNDGIRATFPANAIRSCMIARTARSGSPTGCFLEDRQSSDLPAKDPKALSTRPSQPHSANAIS
jgi:hypothetical protein